MVKSLQIPNGITGNEVLFKLLKHFSDAPFIGALNTCIANLPDSKPEYYHTFDWILGISYDENTPTNTTLEYGMRSIHDGFHETELRWLSTPGIKLGYFSYEMQYQTTGIESALPPAIGNPAKSFWFTPDILVFCQKSTLHAHSHQKSHIATIEIILKNLIKNPNSSCEDLAIISPFECLCKKSDYIKNVQWIQEQIKNGSVYEVNYCIEWTKKYQHEDPIEIWRKIIEKAGSPFANFIKNKTLYILGNSPERFLKKSRQELTSQPIKGTAPRHEIPQKDEHYLNALMQCPKEKAEHIMIVDLVRNDLTRCSIPSSVHVSELQQGYSFKTIHQLISTIKSEIQANTKISNILEATFPMGSMTGAPKIKACQIIEAIEMKQRGIYSGSVGWADSEGNFDLSVAIRTLIIDEQRNQMSIMGGSAITSDSDPYKEWEECHLKVNSILSLLN
jgi:para-aminobenzoate synthetase component 1